MSYRQLFLFMAKRLGIAYAAGKPSRPKDFPQAGSQGGNLLRERPQSKKLKKKKSKIRQ